MSRLLALAGALLLVAGGFLLYARAELFDPDALGQRAAAALADADLRLALSPTIAAAIGDVSPADEPTVEEVTAALEDPRVEGAFAAASAAVAGELFAARSETLALDLADVTTVAISVTNGTPAAELGLTAEELQSARIQLVGADAALDGLSVAEDAGDLGAVLAVIGLIVLLAAVALAPGLLRGVSRAGVALAIAAGLGVATLLAGRLVLAAQFDDELTRSAVEAAWDGLLGDLLLGTAIIGGAALLVALGAGLGAARR